MSAPLKFWFPVKRYGWGWGVPVRWQGWLVLVSYFILIVVGIYCFPPARKPLGFFGYTWALTAILVVIMALKGERPAAWRWGDKKKA